MTLSGGDVEGNSWTGPSEPSEGDDKDLYKAKNDSGVPQTSYLVRMSFPLAEQKILTLSPLEKGLSD